MLQVEPTLEIGINAKLLRFCEKWFQKCRRARCPLLKYFKELIFANPERPVARCTGGRRCRFAYDYPAATIRSVFDLHDAALNQGRLGEDRRCHYANPGQRSLVNSQFDKSEREPVPCMGLQQFGKGLQIFPNPIPHYSN